jgi:hypothetical protein
VLTVYTGGAPPTYLALDDDGGQDVTSRIDLDVTAGTTYYVQVGLYEVGLPAASYRLRLRELIRPQIGDTVDDPVLTDVARPFPYWQDITSGTGSGLNVYKGGSGQVAGARWARSVAAPAEVGWEGQAEQLHTGWVAGATGVEDDGAGGQYDWDWASEILAVYRFTAERENDSFFSSGSVVEQGRAEKFDYSTFGWTDATPVDAPPPMILDTWHPNDSGYATPSGATGWEPLGPSEFIRQGIVAMTQWPETDSAPNGTQAMLYHSDDPPASGRDTVDGNELYLQDVQDSTKYKLIGAFNLPGTQSSGGATWLNRYTCWLEDGYRLPADGHLFCILSPMILPGGTVADYWNKVQDTALPGQPPGRPDDPVEPAPLEQRWNDPGENGTTSFGYGIGGSTVLYVGIQWEWKPPPFRWLGAEVPATPITPPVYTHLRLMNRDDLDGPASGPPLRLTPDPSSRQRGLRVSGYL